MLSKFGQSWHYSVFTRPQLLATTTCLACSHPVQSGPSIGFHPEQLICQQSLYSGALPLYQHQKSECTRNRLEATSTRDLPAPAPETGVQPSIVFNLKQALQMSGLTFAGFKYVGWNGLDTAKVHVLNIPASIFWFSQPTERFFFRFVAILSTAALHVMCMSCSHLDVTAIGST